MGALVGNFGIETTSKVGVDEARKGWLKLGSEGVAKSDGGMDGKARSAVASLRGSLPATTTLLVLKSSAGEGGSGGLLGPINDRDKSRLRRIETFPGDFCFFK